MSEITIAGKTYQVEPRYTEGHEVTAGEAAALNQTLFENVRNNVVASAKRKSEEITQAVVEAYLAAYQFGVRAVSAGGGATRDPVLAQARVIAKKRIADKLAKDGRKLKDVDPEALKAAVAQVLEKYPDIMESARAIVSAQQAAAAESLADIGDLPEKAPAQQAAE